MRKLFLLLVLFATPAFAQTPIDVTSVRFYDSTPTYKFKFFGCNGTPSANNNSDHCVDYTTGKLWHKLVSGGWCQVGDLACSDVTGTLSLAHGGLGTNAPTSFAMLYFDSGTPKALQGIVGTNNQLVHGVTSGAPTFSNLALADIINLGTTTQVLHGNAAGAATFGAVSLVNDVGSSILPVINGGTLRATLCASCLITGAGTAGVNGVSPVAVGQALISNGTGADPVFSNVVTLNGANAGLSSTGDLLIAGTGNLLFGMSGRNVTPQANGGGNLGTDALRWASASIINMSVSTLTAAQTLSTMGSHIVVPSKGTTTLTAAIAGGGTTLTVNDNTFASGDFIMLQAAPGGVAQFEVMKVNSAAGGSAGLYTYTVIRDQDGSGAHAWKLGDAVANTGASTTGAPAFIDIYASTGMFAGTGPAICGSVRTSTSWNSIAPRWCVGNLNGIADYAADTYGLFAGNSAAANVTVDATNGFRVRSGTTNRFQVDASGNLTLGNPAGSRVTWDGTNLGVYTTNVQIDTNGIKVAAASGSVIAVNGYQFSRSAGNTFGVFGFESTTSPFLYLQSKTTTTTDSPNVFLVADSSNTGKVASINLQSTSVAAYTAIISDTIDLAAFTGVPDVRIIGVNNGVLVVTGGAGSISTTTTPTLTGTNITGLPDVALTSNVPLKNAANIFTAAQTVRVDSSADALALTFNNATNAADNGNYLRWINAGYTKNAAIIAGVRNASGTDYILGLGVSNDFSANDAAPSVLISYTGMTLTNYISCGRLSTNGSGLVVCSAYPEPSQIAALQQQVSDLLERIALLEKKK